MRTNRLLLGSVLALGIGGCVMEADEATDDELDESDDTFGTAESLVTVPILPAADATVRSGGDASTKYGSTTSLLTDNDGSSAQKHSYLRFAVPAGTYTKATLRLYVTTSSNNAADVYAISNATWAESTITWNTRPAVDGALLGSIKIAQSSSWVELDVTSAVRAGQPLSLALIPRSADSAAFGSRERSTGKPELVLVKSDGTTTPPTTASCLSGTGPLVTISGAQSSIYDMRSALAASTRVDARTASWTDVANVPVRVGGGDGICWSGGTIKGLWNPLTTSWDTYHDTYAYSLSGNNMTVENLRVDNYGDSVNIRNEVGMGNNFTVRGLHVTNNHDDCFQNDSMKSGTVEQSLFDGCYVFYSSRGYGSAPTNTVTIRNNLVRLQAMPTYYGGSTTDPSQYRHGGFWKIDEFDKAPKLSIHNNIFRADQDSRSWIPLTPDPRSIASASNNVIVWLGQGAFPDPVPPGFTVTTDKAVWDNAVAAWKTSHGSP